MKLKPAQIEPFIRAPDKAIHTVLLYGPDTGLVAERSQQLRSRWLTDPDDPFALTAMKADILQTEPGRLLEEAQAMTLTGGDRVIMVHGAGDASAKSVEFLLEIKAPVAKTIIQAGDLGPGSRLRKRVEASDVGMAVPCYRDEQAGLSRVIRESLNDAGVQFAPDVLDYLSSHLGNDRAVTRSELEKLILFASSNPDRAISLDDVENVISDSAAIGLDRVTTSLFLGDPAGLNRSVDRLLGEAQSPIMIVRGCLRFCMQLLSFRLTSDAGQTIEAVIQSARPPVHFRTKPIISQALRRWRADRLKRALTILLDLEVECKTTGLSDRMMLRRGLMAALWATPPSVKVRP